MDIYDYLKKDHQKVAKLFEMFETATTPSNQAEIVEMILKELTVHAKSEEATFYKVLEERYKTREDAMHGEKEHTEIEDKMREILASEELSADWIKHVLELKAIVEHHVSDEEGQMFDDAKKVLSDQEALIIKERMHDFKDKLLFDENNQ